MIFLGYAYNSYHQGGPAPAGAPWML